MHDHDGALAFACSWWRPKSGTWSHTPESLRSGLVATNTTLRDIEAQPPLWQQAPLAAGLRLSGQNAWKYTRVYQSLQSYRVRRAVQRRQPRAVLQMANLAVSTPVPSFTYMDMGFGVALEYRQDYGRNLISTIPVNKQTLERLANEQLDALHELDGVLVMGRWYRDHLVRNGLAPEKVHVVGGGVAPVYMRTTPRAARPREERTRLLFVGGEFVRKGGDDLLAALRQLNASGERRLTLTVAGPVSWPLAEPVPEWVDFRGPQSREQIRDLFDAHDVFVLPSRFEAYGMVFLEARARGLPCVGREAFAMPELIEPGVGGAVWSSARVEDLADTIAEVLDDDALHERCAQNATSFSAANSWTHTAERVLDCLPG